MDLALSPLALLNLFTTREFSEDLMKARNPSPENTRMRILTKLATKTSHGLSRR